MTDCDPSLTAMTSGFKFSKDGTDFFEDPSLYRSILGALQYFTITRSKIPYCMNKVC